MPKSNVAVIERPQNGFNTTNVDYVVKVVNVVNSGMSKAHSGKYGFRESLAKNRIITRYEQEIINLDNEIEKLSIMLKDFYKSTVIQALKEQGANDEKIEELLTDAEIEFGLNNNIMPDDLAWGLLF